MWGEGGREGGRERGRGSGGEAEVGGTEEGKEGEDGGNRRNT